MGDESVTLQAVQRIFDVLAEAVGVMLEPSAASASARKHRTAKFGVLGKVLPVTERLRRRG